MHMMSPQSLNTQTRPGKGRGTQPIVQINNQPLSTNRCINQEKASVKKKQANKSIDKGAEGEERERECVQMGLSWSRFRGGWEYTCTPTCITSTSTREKVSEQDHVYFQASLIWPKCYKIKRQRERSRIKTGHSYEFLTQRRRWRERGVRTEGLKDRWDTINISERGFFSIGCDLAALPVFMDCKIIKCRFLSHTQCTHISINKIIKLAWGLGVSRCSNLTCLCQDLRDYSNVSISVGGDNHGKMAPDCSNQYIYPYMSKGNWREVFDKFHVGCGHDWI